MKSVKLSLIFLMVFAISLTAYSQTPKAPQEDKGTKLVSENLESEEKILNSQIADYTSKIQDVVKKYNLVGAQIKVLPYQVSYAQEKDYIFVQKHVFLREQGSGKIIGEKAKSIKIYTDGSTIKKLESEVRERNYDAGTDTIVKITDNAPLAEGTPDLTFTQTVNGKVVNTKKMAEIKNTLAFPIRNDLKRDFYIPHLSYFYTTILNIAETYNKNIKDADSDMTDFLKKSTQY